MSITSTCDLSIHPFNSELDNSIDVRRNPRHAFRVRFTQCQLGPVPKTRVVVGCIVESGIAMPWGCPSIDGGSFDLNRPQRSSVYKCGKLVSVHGPDDSDKFARWLLTAGSTRLAVRT